VHGRRAAADALRARLAGGRAEDVQFEEACHDDGRPPARRPRRARSTNLLGDKDVPADAYYGVQTRRALENFQLSGIPINRYPGYVEAWAIVKLAAARANTAGRRDEAERLAMIEKACQAVRDGKYHDQFMVDWYQGGAGTSTNMNANEVLAERRPRAGRDTRRASTSTSSRTTT
jgi:fumarate hydratase class II